MFSFLKKMKKNIFITLHVYILDSYNLFIKLIEIWPTLKGSLGRHSQILKNTSSFYKNPC
jgi:hypothetical protein